MRVFTFQDRNFVDCLLNLLQTNELINYNVLNEYDFVFDDALLNKKEVYNNKDFLYTFYNNAWQNGKSHEFFVENCDLYYLIHNYTGIYSMRNASLIELDVDPEEGLFGVLGINYAVQKLLNYEDILKADNEYDFEFVLPCIKKKWIVEIYDLLNETFNNEMLNPKTGFLVKPRYYTNRKDKALTTSRVVLSNEYLTV